ncbi:hypothetical protein TURU_014451 [Turdus rufiventris]|nr:hypothetical protein TURU_014451 [Turdus rufiventris]
MDPGTVVLSSSTGGNGQKLMHRKLQLDMRKNFTVQLGMGSGSVISKLARTDRSHELPGLETGNKPSPFLGNKDLSSSILSTPSSYLMNEKSLKRGRGSQAKAQSSLVPDLIDEEQFITDGLRPEEGSTGLY